MSIPISVQTGDTISVNGCIVEWNNRVIVNIASLGDAYSQSLAESFYNQVSKYPEFFNVYNRTNGEDGLNELLQLLKRTLMNSM